MDRQKSLKITLVIIFIISFIVVGIWIIRENKEEKEMEKGRKEQKQEIVKKDYYAITGDYNTDIIKKFHELEDNKNYLISPYNIEMALNMLRDGALGNTKGELDKVLRNRIINDVSVKDKVGIANAVFIKNMYKDNVKSDYYNTLNTKYNSDIIYDEFNTPNKINDWVNTKTNGMIPKLLDKMDKDFVMGLASALAIDVNWLSEFSCSSTKSEKFTKTNNEEINVEMMHKELENGNYQYIKTDDAEGIIIPYQKEDNSNVQLEFVGILPNDNINEYVKKLTKEKLDNIFNNTRSAGDNLTINLSLPRFKYDYEAKEEFVEVLKGLGIKDIFDKDNANFKKMIEITENVYVGEAIHKTHIELNEVGTKAAAITYFGMFRNSAMRPVEKEIINIAFNKPFAYLIREKNTGEILFFGVVYEPNVWNGSTCDNQ